MGCDQEQDGVVGWCGSGKLVEVVAIGNDGAGEDSVAHDGHLERFLFCIQRRRSFGDVSCSSGNFRT